MSCSLTINATDALNLSLQFSEFQIPKNSVFSIYTKNELTDSITANENNEKNIWATRVYQGSILTLVLKTTYKEKENARLQIGSVNFGYKNFGVLVDFANPDVSEPCHINANCPAGNNWNNEKNSVAMIVANGIIQCTGSLIMNTGNTNTPYFLTANHCLGAGNVPNWVFQFQTLSTDCATNTGWREDIQFNGCTLRANNGASDFALLQLNTTPLVNSGLFYSGWSRQTTGNTSTTILHHPAGDLMKISVDNQAPTALTSLGVDVWQIDQDLGRLQGGSSGAPYYNQNHQIIGQHWRRPEAGTIPICDITIAQGGRFDRSWTGGGTNATRLNNWLDPSGTGATTTNTTNVSALCAASSGASQISGPSSFCTSATYSISNVPPGATVSWSASPAGIVTLSSNGTQDTATRVSDGTFNLTATVATACSTYTVSSGYINVGSTNPWSESIGGLDLSDNCTNTMKTPWVSDLGAGSSYQWYIYPGTPGTDYYFYNVDNNASLQFYTPGNYEIVVKATSSCGHAFRASTYYEVSNCYNYYRVSPNPATSDITVYVDEEGLKKQKIEKSSEQSIQKIIIMDKQGNALVQQSYPTDTRKVTLHTSGLSSDMYVVRIFNGKKWTSVKFLKK